MAAYSYEYVAWETGFYAANSSTTYGSYLPVLVLFLTAVYYVKDFVWPLAAFAPIVLLGPVVGFEQVNLYAWFVFLWFAIKVNGGVNFGIIASSSYLTFKTIGFVANVINTGQGF